MPWGKTIWANYLISYYRSLNVITFKTPLLPGFWCCSLERNTCLIFFHMTLRNIIKFISVSRFHSHHKLPQDFVLLILTHITSVHLSLADGALIPHKGTNKLTFQNKYWSNASSFIQRIIILLQRRMCESFTKNNSLPTLSLSWLCV